MKGKIILVGAILMVSVHYLKAQQNVLTTSKQVPVPNKLTLDSVKHQTNNYYKVRKTDSTIVIQDKGVPTVPAKKKTNSYSKPYKNPYMKEEE